MLKLNIADYLILNLNEKDEDNHQENINKNIDFLIDTWSQRQYLASKQVSNDDFELEPNEIVFDNYSLRAIAR